MSRNNSWRLIIIIAVLLFSLNEIFFRDYRFVPRDLVEHFAERARVAPTETTFSNIVFAARAMQKTNAGQAFANLQVAIGTNDIRPYFPFDARNEPAPTTYILNRLQREAAGKIKLGLDLQGGTSFLVEMDMTKLSDTNELSGALSQAIEVLRKRVDRFGVAEPVIRPAGNNRIEIQLPGLSEDDRARAKVSIQKTAFLEFRLAHEQTDQLVEAGEVPPGYELLQHKSRPRTGGERLERVIVKKKGEPGLTGSIVKQAMAVPGNFGEPQINFQLNDSGAARFAEITRENRGRKLAIVLDGELYSAPNINEPIETGNGQITGNFSEAEARELAGVLENPLRAPLRILYSTEIDPTLGKDMRLGPLGGWTLPQLATGLFLFWKLFGSSKFATLLNQFGPPKTGVGRGTHVSF